MADTVDSSHHRRGDHCALCSTPFNDIAGNVLPVVAVQVGRVGIDDGPMTVVAIGAMRFEAVSMVDRLAREVLIMTCSQPCHDRVTALIAGEEMRAQSESAVADTPLPHVRAGRVAPAFRQGLPGSVRWFANAGAEPAILDQYPSLKYECAECGKALARDARICSVDAVQTRQEGPDTPDQLTSVVIAGRTRQALSLGDMLPREILLMTCSLDCRAALTQAIADDEDRLPDTAASSSPDGPRVSHVRRGRLRAIAAGLIPVDVLTGVTAVTAAGAGGLPVEPVSDQRPAARRDRPDRGRDARSTPSDRDPARSRARDEQRELTFGESCAWCLRTISPDARVDLLSVDLTDTEPGFFDHIVQFVNVGDRPVHGWVLHPRHVGRRRGPAHRVRVLQPGVFPGAQSLGAGRPEPRTPGASARSHLTRARRDNRGPHGPHGPHGSLRALSRADPEPRDPRRKLKRLPAARARCVRRGRPDLGPARGPVGAGHGFTARFLVASDHAVHLQ